MTMTPVTAAPYALPALGMAVTPGDGRPLVVHTGATVAPGPLTTWRSARQ